MSGERKRWEIWIEGYATNGERSTAELFGVVTGADNFRDAVKGVMAWKDGVDVRYYRDGDPPTYWGCRLFDNEADARKAFG